MRILGEQVNVTISLRASAKIRFVTRRKHVCERLETVVVPAAAIVQTGCIVAWAHYRCVVRNVGAIVSGWVEKRREQIALLARFGPLTARGYAAVLRVFVSERLWHVPARVRPSTMHP